jgi:hypothetical protein
MRQNQIAAVIEHDLLCADGGTVIFRSRLVRHHSIADQPKAENPDMMSA